MRNSNTIKPTAKNDEISPEEMRNLGRAFNNCIWILMVASIIVFSGFFFGDKILKENSQGDTTKARLEFLTKDFFRNSP